MDQPTTTTKRFTNREFAQVIQVFRTACEKAKVETTVRQASKFRNRKGLAFSYKYKLL